MIMHPTVNNQHKILIWLFIASEAIFFIALIIGYLYYYSFSPEWKSSTHYLDLNKTLFFTFLLILSSVTIEISERMKRKSNKKMYVLFLFLSIALGLLFLIGQGMEYYRLFQMQLYPQTNIFGSAFFTLTGFHGLHVFIGLCGLLLLLFFSFSEHQYHETRAAVYPISVYWHFVDVVWLFVFSVVYLLPTIV